MFESDSERHPRPLEINVETPIFHALTAGLSIGLSTGSPVAVPSSAEVSPYGQLLDPQPVDPGPEALIEFHRDPLLAPIPIQAYVEAASPPAHAAPTMIAPLPPTAGSSHGSALSMMTSSVGNTLRSPASGYGRHHRSVPALPCAYRW